MISFTTPKHLGRQYGTIIRQCILSQSECVRVVAFSLGEQTILNSGNIDLVNLSADLASLDIEFDSYVQYPLNYSISVSEILTVGDLRAQGIDVLNKEDDFILLDTVGTNVTINLIVNKVSGYMSSEDNRNSLVSVGQSVVGYNVISSRSQDLKVALNVKDNLDSDEVTLSVDSSDENRILKESVGDIMSVLGTILTKIS